MGVSCNSSPRRRRIAYYLHVICMWRGKHIQPCQRKCNYASNGGCNSNFACSHCQNLLLLHETKDQWNRNWGIEAHVTFSTHLRRPHPTRRVHHVGVAGWANEDWNELVPQMLLLIASLKWFRIRKRQMQKRDRASQRNTWWLKLLCWKMDGLAKMKLARPVLSPGGFDWLCQETQPIICVSTWQASTRLCSALVFSAQQLSPTVVQQLVAGRRNR